MSRPVYLYPLSSRTDEMETGKMSGSQNEFSRANLQHVAYDICLRNDVPGDSGTPTAFHGEGGQQLGLSPDCPPEEE